MVENVARTMEIDMVNFLKRWRDFRNHIDNVAITKHFQKGPRAARDPSHPCSGALQLSVTVLKHLYTWSGPAWP